MQLATGPKDGEERLRRMMAEYQTPLLRTCWMLLKDRALAEDAVQENFLKAYRSLSSFQGTSSEKTWLMRIAVNVCRDVRRKSWFRLVDRRVKLEDLPEPAVPFEERDDTLTQAIAHLPQKERETLLLYFYQDLTMKPASPDPGSCLE